MEEQGIDPCAFCMQSRRSTIWATPPTYKKKETKKPKSHITKRIEGNKTKQNKTQAALQSECSAPKPLWHFSLFPYLSFDREWWEICVKKKEKNEGKMDSTPHCSRVVPHPSTEQAQTALTSVFGWEPVDYDWYGRIQRTWNLVLRNRYKSESIKVHKVGLEPL